MHVVTRNNPFDNLDAQLFANLPDDIAYAHPKLAFQHRVAILGDPDDVITVIENGVRAGIVGHIALLKIDLTLVEPVYFHEISMYHRATC